MNKSKILSLLSCLTVFLLIGFFVDTIYAGPVTSDKEDGCIFGMAETESGRGDLGGCGSPSALARRISFNSQGIVVSKHIAIPKIKSQSTWEIKIVDGVLPEGEKIRLMELSGIRADNGTLYYPNDSEMIYSIFLSPKPHDSNKFLLDLSWQEVDRKGSKIIKTMPQPIELNNNARYVLDVTWKQRDFMFINTGSIEVMLMNAGSGGAMVFNQQAVFSLGLEPIASSYFLGSLNRILPGHMSSGFLCVSQTIGVCDLIL